MVNSLNDSVLRKAAKSRGYNLKKSHSNSLDNMGGYMITDNNNYIVAGEKYDFTPEMVRDFLNEG